MQPGRFTRFHILHSSACTRKNIKNHSSVLNFSFSMFNFMFIPFFFVFFLILPFPYLSQDIPNHQFRNAIICIGKGTNKAPCTSWKLQFPLLLFITWYAALPSSSAMSNSNLRQSQINFKRPYPSREMYSSMTALTEQKKGNEKKTDCAMKQETGGTG